MCGRYKMTQHPLVPEIFRRIGVLMPEDGWVPRWNIGPMQKAMIVVSDRGARSVETARWGFVPAYEKLPKPKVRPINAKSETVRTSGMFRQAWHTRRCLVPMTGFYEWEGPPETRVPNVFERAGEPFFLGGIWSRWQPGPEHPVEMTYAILTLPAWPPVDRLHDRSPLVVEPEDADTWLDGDPEGAFGLVRPPRRVFTGRRVSPRVNNVRNEGPDLDASDG